MYFFPQQIFWQEQYRCNNINNSVTVSWCCVCWITDMTYWNTFEQLNRDIISVINHTFDFLALTSSGSLL